MDATHAAENMPTGMLRRGARYYLRRRVPLDLIVAYGKNEIVKALGTSDYPEAKKRLTVEWVALDKEFDEQRANLASPTDAETPGPQAEGLLAKYREGRAKPRSIFQTIVDGNKRMDAALGRSPQSPDPVADVARKPLTWDKLVDKWAAERTPTPKTRKDHASVVKLFQSMVGTPPNAVSKADVLLFKDKLLEKRTSSANLKTKLSRLKTLINYGHDNGLVKERAADGIRIAKSKVKSRAPFDDQALQQVFGGPVHKQGYRPILGRGEAAFWLPLIALYTGARLEEIAGLRVDDLMELEFEADGADKTAWFFRFSPYPLDNRRLKNDGSERTVPIHPELIRLGLLRYRETVLVSDEPQLFPRLTKHASGKRAHKWGQWFGTYTPMIRDDETRKASQ